MASRQQNRFGQQGRAVEQLAMVLIKTLGETCPLKLLASRFHRAMRYVDRRRSSPIYTRKQIPSSNGANQNIRDAADPLMSRKQAAEIAEKVGTTAFQPIRNLASYVAKLSSNHLVTTV
jgi:hypothetical protein